MKAFVMGAAVIAYGVAAVGVPRAAAAVDLVLAPEPRTVPLGATVEIGLYAVSHDGGNESFSSMDVVLTWDASALELLGAVHNGPHAWMMSGFKFDQGLDGLNADCGPSEFCSPYTETPYNDGNALYQALSISPATATRGGLLVATLHFRALANVELTHVVIEPELGRYSHTQVFGTDEPGQDVTGTLGTAGVKIADAVLTAADLLLPAGRTGEILVSGEIAGQSTFGVTLALELVRRAGTGGTMGFTPAPPADIRILGDPWPGSGSFSAFDTDVTGSPALNGSWHDNGAFVPAAVTFAGVLSGFPVTATADAEGVWDIKLTAPDDTNSSWEGLATALAPGTLTVVQPGDGDGSGKTDVRDFGELQACFTGPVGPADPPGYSPDPGLRCCVYDFDQDGDIDAADFAAFGGRMSGAARSGD